MSTRKEVSIFGSSGAQGSSVIHYLLNFPTYDILAHTNSSPEQTALYLPSPAKHPNLRINQLADTTLASLTEAISTSHIVFANTNSNAPSFEAKGAESQALKNIVDACISFGSKVELLILSVLPDLGESSKGCRSFEEKGKGMKYAMEAAAGTNLKLVFVELGWYFSNLLVYTYPTVAEDGVVEFRFDGIGGNIKVPWVSTYTDLGPIVKGIIEYPECYNGKEIPVVSEVLTMNQVAEIYGRVTGQPTRFVSKVDSDETVPKESISGPDIDAYAPEWPLLIRILNSASYFVDDSILELGNEILEKEGTGKNLTTWEQWLLNTGFDAKKEGFGDQVKEQLQRWGGRVFI